MFCDEVVEPIAEDAEGFCEDGPEAAEDFSELDPSVALKKGGVVAFPEEDQGSAFFLCEVGVAHFF